MDNKYVKIYEEINFRNQGLYDEKILVYMYFIINNIDGKYLKGFEVKKNKKKSEELIKEVLLFFANDRNSELLVTHYNKLTFMDANWDLTNT